MLKLKMARKFEITVRMKNGGKVKKMLILKMAGNFKNDRKNKKWWEILKMIERIKNGGKI
jgi:hypothetical protein